MSAKYSVGQILAHAKLIREREHPSICNDDAADMLEAYAERIEADERAVRIAWLEAEPSASLESLQSEFGMFVHSMQFHVGKSKPANRPVLNKLFPLFTYPPAQAAQVDDWRDRYASLCSRIGMDPYKWNGTNGYSEDEVWDHIKELENHAPAHPHSPDAADSGRVVDELPPLPEPITTVRYECPAGCEDEAGRWGAFDDDQMRAYARAALAAQGQGEAVAEVYEYPRDHHEPRPTMLKGICFTGVPLPVGTKLFTRPATPASPAGVPDGKVIVTGFLPKSRVVELRFDSALPAWICEPGVHVTVAAAPSATPEGGEVGL